MSSKFARYHLLVNGEHCISCQHFGDANRAAFDDLPGFQPLESGEPRAVTTVVGSDGRTLASYELLPGRLARPLDVLGDTAHS